MWSRPALSFDEQRDKRDWQAMFLALCRFVAVVENRPPLPPLFLRHGEAPPPEPPAHFCLSCNVRQFNEHGRVNTHLDGCIVEEARTILEGINERQAIDNSVYSAIRIEMEEALIEACASEWSTRITKPENRWSTTWWKIEQAIYRPEPELEWGIGDEKPFYMKRWEPPAELR